MSKCNKLQYTCWVTNALRILPVSWRQINAENFRHVRYNLIKKVYTLYPY